MRALLLPVLLGLAACPQGKPAVALPIDAGGPTAAAPRWPPDLERDLVSLRIARTRGQEPRRETLLAFGDGGWRVLAPHRGEADPDALKTLFLALRAPQVLSSVAQVPDGGAPAFELTFGLSDGGERRLTTLQVPLGEPVIAQLIGVGTFRIAPTEFASGLPDPTDFLSPGLWLSAPAAFDRLTVKGKTRYQLDLVGTAWRCTPKPSPAVELEDVVGVFPGREATAHLTLPTKALGLAPPAATATLCAGATCREFRFGSAVVDGQQGYFAVGPDADPIAIHPNDWALVVDGPFGRKR